MGPMGPQGPPGRPGSEGLRGIPGPAVSAITLSSIDRGEMGGRWAASQCDLISVQEHVLELSGSAGLWRTGTLYRQSLEKLHHWTTVPRISQPAIQAGIFWELFFLNDFSKLCRYA